MAVTLAAVVVTAGVVYAFIESGQNFRANGAVMVWNAVITKDMPLLPSIMQWLPVLAALVVGLAQFIPEMTDKRLKLTFHLPMPETKILAVMLIYGEAVLGTIYAATYAALAIGFSVNYPPEIVAAMCWKSLPWFAAGLCLYLLTAWVCMEPLWRWKIADALVASSFVAMFFIDAPSGSYAPVMPWLAGLTLLCFCFPFHSAARFKEGAQK